MADCCGRGNEHSAHKRQGISRLSERLLVFRGFLCFPLTTRTLIPRYLTLSILPSYYSHSHTALSDTQYTSLLLLALSYRAIWHSVYFPLTTRTLIPGYLTLSILPSYYSQSHTALSDTQYTSLLLLALSYRAIWHSVYFPLTTRTLIPRYLTLSILPVTLLIRSRNLCFFNSVNTDNIVKFRILWLIRGLTTVGEIWYIVRNLVGTILEQREDFVKAANFCTLIKNV